jgi:hypothetical protein
MKQRLCHFTALCIIALLQPTQAQETASAGELVVIDLRPKEEREGTGLSALSGKCNKGVYRIADVASDPLKVDVLKTNLAQQLGMAGDGKTLTVLNWTVYYNKSAGRGGGPNLSNIGIQGYTLPGSKKEKQLGSKCSREESGGGWYEASDVTTTGAPLVSEFEGTFAGKPYSVRAVYSPRLKLVGKFQGDPDDTAALLEVVQKTAEALAAAIVQ